VQRIKIFKGLESDLAELESQVNQWLAESQARVINMFGNIAPQSGPTASPQPGGPTYITKSPFAPSDVLLVILFEQH